MQLPEIDIYSRKSVYIIIMVSAAVKTSRFTKEARYLGLFILLSSIIQVTNGYRG